MTADTIDLRALQIAANYCLLRLKRELLARDPAIVFLGGDMPRAELRQLHLKLTDELQTFGRPSSWPCEAVDCKISTLADCVMKVRGGSPTLQFAQPELPECGAAVRSTDPETLISLRVWEFEKQEKDGAHTDVRLDIFFCWTGEAA